MRAVLGTTLFIVVGVGALYAYRAQFPAASRTPAPTATAAPSARPAATTAVPSPNALVSAHGFITVRQPQANARVVSPVTISGDASVFEATLGWRVTDTAGRTFAEGIASASAGAPERGTFSVAATYADPAADTLGLVEVFERSPKDGSIDEVVRVPVILAKR